MFNNIKMSVFSKFLVTLLQNKYLLSRDWNFFKQGNDTELINDSESDI